MKYKKVFEKINIGTLELKNRFVVPPMCTNYADHDGFCSQAHADYYAERAKGGFGLIIQEISAVDPRGRATPLQIGVWDDKFIPGLKNITDAVHDKGGKIIIQLHHCGRQTEPSAIDGQSPVAVSRIACPMTDALPEELTVEQIKELVSRYGDAAVRAKKAGYDGVELHGANGYLIQQFMSPHSNKRMDEYGGSFSGRMRFPLEVIKDVREKVGDDYPVVFRIGLDEFVPGGMSIELASAIAREVEEAGVDAIDMSVCSYVSFYMMSPSQNFPSGFNQTLAKRLKESINIPVCVVGRVNMPEIAEDILAAGYADLVDIGRESIAEPYFPNKIAENRLDDICPCISCLQSCLGYQGRPDKNCRVSCLANPVVGHEGEYDMSKVSNPKKVLVVGAGPAGIYAARFAALRGHNVTLCEKGEKMGGQFRLAGMPPTKHEIMNLLKFNINQCRANGVDIKLGTEVTEDFIKELAPDAVILATGGEQIIPKIKGIESCGYLTVEDVLDGRVLPGKNVLVCGGGESGAETAHFLGEHKRNVTVIDMLPEIAAEAHVSVRQPLMKNLENYKVNIITNAKIVEFEKGRVKFEKDREEKKLGGFDSIILALGVKTVNPLEEAAKKLVNEVYVVGDALKTGQANKAIEEGLQAALSL